MTDALSKLPRLSWRGIEVPLVARSVSFEHEHVRHKYTYRDNELIESLGAHNWLFDYVIPFRQDIAKGPYEDLYAKVFPAFVLACRDRDVGELLDPVLGKFDARCVSLSVQTDIQRRDGEDVSVSFLHSPKPNADEAVRNLDGLAGTSGDAKRLNEQVQLVSEDELSAAGLINEDISVGPDFLDQIAGFGQQVAAQGNRVNAQVAKFEHQIGKIESALDAINKHTGDPRHAPAIRSARRLHDALNRVKNKAAFPGKTLVSTIVGSDTTVGPLAQALGLSVAEFVLLNPNVTLPLIPAGTSVSYFLS